MIRLLCLVLAFMLSFNIVAQDKILLDKVVATIGGEILLYSDIEENYALLASRNANLPEGAKCYVVDQLLVQKLLLNQARLDSIEISDAEIDAQFNARFEQILGMMNNDPQQFQEYYGQSIPEVREKYREDMKNQLLADRMKNDIVSSVQITPSEVKEFFNKIPRDSLPYFSAEVEVGEIVYFPKINKEEKQKALDEAESYLKQIKDGTAKFEDLASVHSDDPGSARLGGDLGWRKRGDFVVEFEAAAYNLENGEISDIVESEFGYHIIQLIERRGNRIHTRHILVRPEITLADQDLAKNTLDSIQQLIVNDSIGFDFGVKKYSSDKVFSYNNGGIMMNPKTGNSFFEVGDLDPEIYFAIDTMKVGGVSQAMEFTAQSGETAYRIIQLRSQTEPHIASLEQDYSKIKKAALEAKKSNYIYNWIFEALEKTHIRLDNQYSRCDDLKKWYK